MQIITMAIGTMVTMTMTMDFMVTVKLIIVFILNCKKDVPSKAQKK